MKQQTVAKVAIWAFIAFVIFRGVVTIINPPQTIIEKEVYTKNPAESDKVKAFAEQFAREYFNYTIKSEDYEERLRKYSNLNFVNISSDLQSNSEVLESNIYDVMVIDEQNSIVTVFCKVRKWNEVEEIKDWYIEVPVQVSGEKCAISDFPKFIKPSEMADAYNFKFKGITVEANKQDSIKDFLVDFFNIFDEGTNQQISYFFINPEAAIRGYEKSFDFVEIKDLHIMGFENNQDKYYVNTTIVVKDSFGTKFYQKYIFIMINKENTFFIEDVLNSNEKILTN